MDITILPTSPQLGRTTLSHRLALAKLQVLWPLMCCISITGSVYGFAERRATSLGLDRREMLRWWHEYKCRGVAGVIPSGVQAKWKLWLPELEPVLETERAEWRDAGDVFFCEELHRFLAFDELHKPLRLVKEIASSWPTLLYAQDEPHGIKPYKGFDREQTEHVARQIGIAREVLLLPVVPRRYTDAAINSYATDWCTSGATMRLWLDWYQVDLGYRSVMPSKLTAGQVDWLALVSDRLKALTKDDVRRNASYWNELTGSGLTRIGKGVADKRLSGDAENLARERYERVKLTLVQHLARTQRRRNNNQAGIAKALGVSEQTITNWKNDYARGQSLKPSLMTEGMASKLDDMEQVVRALQAAAPAPSSD